MTLPPRRLFDVWSDTDYDFAESKPERLLLAALDYSTERFVVYVAREAAAVGVSLDRGAFESQDSVRADRPALAHQAQEAARGARAR